MFCKRCGFNLNPNDKFCKNCGQSVEQTGMNSPTNIPNGQNNYLNNQQSNNYNNVNSLGTMNTSNNQSNYNNMNNYGQMNSSISNNIPGNFAPQNVYTPNSGAMSFNANNNMNSYPINNQNNKSSKGGIITIIVIFVLAVIAAFCVIVLPKIIKKDSGSDVKTTNTYKVNYDGYAFNIPNNLDYEISDDNELVVYSDADGWAVYIIIKDGSYGQLKINLEQMKSNLASQGYIVTKTETKTFRNKEFLNIYTTYSGEEFVYTCTKLSNNKFFLLGVFDLSYEFDDSLFNTIASILETVESSSSYNSLKIDVPNMKQIKFLN
ncbi:MAG: zinc ribbon domain-containing protein [Bacilli bacterium]|nr:zinc ribbon domain-containing protein [Bacilli bacterium]